MVPHDFVPMYKQRMNRIRRRREFIETVIGVLVFGAALAGIILIGSMFY